MALETAVETTDVIICGCGPTGAMLSALLGQHSVPNIVLERDGSVNSDPRGIALDEDGIRALQACGIYGKIFTEICQCMGLIKFIGGVHHDLDKKQFLALDYNTTEGGTGHPGFIRHKQPSIESSLRSQIEKSPDSQLRLLATVTSIHEDSNWVYATYADETGQKRCIRGKFLVGADGKTGFTKKNYLEHKGIIMETVSQLAYSETWVALNWKISLPTTETHPDFPLWTKGYSPEQVYEMFFPTNFRFLCNPKRPAVYSRFGLDQDWFIRVEFLVLPGENGTEMAGEEKLREVVFPYFTHPGHKYGLDVKEVQYPNDCINVLRSRPFKFSARSCNKWALDRVILCGDAAHVFPPFGGQGIASGFRDAISLAWRLALATKQVSWTDQVPNYHALLEGWYTERKQQLDKSLADTIESGDYVNKGDPLSVFIRDWYLWAVQLVPAWKRQLEKGNRREGMVRYKWEESKAMLFLPSMGGGGNFPQVYCVNLNEHQKNRAVQFTDDAIFAPEKQALFQLVVFLVSLQDLEEAQQALEGLHDIANCALRVEETTFILKTTDAPNQSIRGTDIYRLATDQEFAADPVLCAGRPEPQYYDPVRIINDTGNKQFVVLRPD